MRLNRLQHRHHVRSSDGASPSAAVRTQRARAGSDSGFDAAARRGPVLSPAQEQVKVAIDAVLKEFASQLLALANGKAPAATPTPTPTPTPAPAVEEREEGTPGPGDTVPKEPTPGGQWTGFSPAPPPGVADPRDPGPYSIADKKADSFPKQLPGESLAQYAMRTAPQTGFQVSALGGFLGTVTAPPGTPFPELVDRFQNPTAYWDKGEVDRQNMMREADIKAASRIYTGPVPVSSLSVDDKRYLFGMCTALPGVYELLSGPKLDISRMINDTVYNLGGANDFSLRDYRGQMRPYVEKMLAEKGLKHP